MRFSCYRERFREFRLECLAGNDLLNISLLKGTNSPNFPLVKVMTFYDDKVL